MKKKLFFSGLIALLISFNISAQVYSEDFETGGGDNWTLVDHDGDGIDWIFDDASGLSNILGSTSLVSFSYTNNAGPLEPDNLAISPAIDLSAPADNLFLSYDYVTEASYPEDKYSIYVTTSNDPDDILAATPVYTETVEVGGIIHTNYINVSDYIGETIYITLRHYDCVNQYYLIMDNLEIKELDLEDANAELTSIDTPGIINNGDNEVVATIENTGLNNITSVELNWQVDGGDTYTETVNGLNISYYNKASVSHPDMWDAQSGSHDLTVWVSKVNGTALATNSEVTKTIEVATNATQRMPLFERFTSSTCAPCASFNQAQFNAFFDQNQDDFIYIAYHMNYPGNGDPYYQSEATVRHNYYGVTGIPALFTGGKEFSIGAQDLNNTLDSRMQAPAFMEISSAEATIDEDGASVDISIMPYVSGDYKLYAAVIEGETTGNVATNGETEFSDVMMKMLPNAQGTNVTFTADTEYETTLSASLANTFIEQYQDLKVIVYIQKADSKEIMQAARANTEILSTNNYSQKELSIFPNPVSNGYLHINTQETGSIEVYDIAGRLILQDANIKIGENLINTKGFNQGIYMLKLTTSSNKTYTQKIIVE